MHIDAIEYSDITFRGHGCEAIVTLLTRTGAVHCVCQVPIGPSWKTHIVHGALLTEALRQIARMPEYRREPQRITLAHHLRDDPLPLAA